MEEKGYRENLRMRRCFDLAALGRRDVQCNPIVGAILVDETGRIKSEGYYRKFGGPHAEVNCLKDVPVEASDQLYVSLEPCNVHGKTPPCRDLILDRGVNDVSVSISDPNPLISGESLRELEEGGVKCHSNILPSRGKRLIQQFRISVQEQRPYIVLKWAQSIDGFIGRLGERVAISDEISNRLVHKWRGECDGIMVGTNTVVNDNPQLTVRKHLGSNPLRIILDRHARIPLDAQVFNSEASTIVFTKEPDTQIKQEQIRFEPYPEDAIERVFSRLYELKIGTVLVEGGATLLNDLIQRGLWDEMRVITSSRILDWGIKAPTFCLKPQHELRLGNDVVRQYFPGESAAS